MMNEEGVTLRVMDWLREKGWEILAFDFPQSGTGIALHPKGSTSKTEGIVIPDVLARKRTQDSGVVFENKDRLVLSDFEKIERMRKTDIYLPDVAKAYGGTLPGAMFYGVALPISKETIGKTLEHRNKVDFIVGLREDGEIELIHLSQAGLFDG